MGSLAVRAPEHHILGCQKDSADAWHRIAGIERDVTLTMGDASTPIFRDCGGLLGLPAGSPRQPLLYTR